MIVLISKNSIILDQIISQSLIFPTAQMATQWVIEQSEISGDCITEEYLAFEQLDIQSEKQKQSLIVIK